MAANDEQWKQGSDVLSVFPTLVWQVQLRPALEKDIGAGIRGVLDRTRSELPDLGPGEAWQSPRDLHERPEISALVSCIRRSARSVIQFLKIGSEDFEITGCWANVNAPGASHAVHSHPNNFLSGVYYVQVQPGGDTINFHDPRIQTGIIRPPVTELTQENTDQVVVSVSDGMLLVFPSYLQHSVASNQSDAERISVSFNIMFSAYTENLSRPLW